MRMKMMKQWIKKNNNNNNNTIKKWYFRWSNWQIKIIWRTNKIVKKREDLTGFYPYKDFGDKELKSKYFKIKLADMSNEIDEKLFEKIFGHTLIKLVDKLINTTNKEENQIIVKNIEKNKDKLFKEDEFYNFVIQPQKRSDLKYTIDLILDFNETIQLDLV